VSAALSDPNDGVVGYLIDPEGEAVASSSNITLDSTASNAILTGSLNVYKDNPEPGRWTFALDWLPPMDPDLEASNPGNGDSASLDINPGGGEVAPGLWFLNPSGIGPYGPGGAPSETASAGFGAVTQAFDPTADTSSRGRAPRFRSRSRRQPARERRLRVHQPRRRVPVRRRQPGHRLPERRRARVDSVQLHGQVGLPSRTAQ
jgi:hypothetical protein